MGNPLQPIDRINVLPRPHVDDCYAWFIRDSGLNTAISNDTASLAVRGPTPQNALCGALPDPITAPWSWHSTECGPQLARFVWVRQPKFW
jgi:hypothetical protein